ncbi:hypothetical protein KI387_012556, partial [Taxus chinensis]
MKMMRKMNVVILLASFQFFVGIMGDNTTIAELYEVASSLDMFMDDVPDMPKLRGYVYKDKKLKSDELRIRMFKTKWGPSFEHCVCLWIVEEDENFTRSYDRSGTRDH